MFLYQQQQQLCYTIGSTIFALAWRVQPCFAALLCACLFAHDSEYTRTHAHTTRKYTHTHTFAQAQTTTGTQAEVVSLCSFEFAACAADDHFVCMCARDSVVEFAVVRWIQFNTNTHTLPTTHAHQRRPHSLFSLSIFCTHAYTPNGCNCVRAVRACVLITLAYVLALNTDCQKSNCTEWNEMKKKSARVLLSRRFCLFFFSRSSATAAVAVVASAAANNIALPLLPLPLLPLASCFPLSFGIVLLSTVAAHRCAGVACSVLTTRQNEQQTAT